ncbi:MAG: DUF2330 domain-containing protein [Gemmataceae bacterium]
MNSHIRLVLPSVAVALTGYLATTPANACCPVPPPGQSVVNADQTVVMIWDAATKTQHFIRQASFKSGADDFGFLIPSPTQPELDESGNEVFPYLQDLTKPEVIVRQAGRSGCGCSSTPPPMAMNAAVKSDEVRVLERKFVAGLDAAVLEVKSADALTQWLKDHNYAYSPAVEAWAKPYVEMGWKITALKVAKPEPGAATKDVAATALRLSFKTDRPLFPYREPDYGNAATNLGNGRRSLRIFFVADARFQGGLTKEAPWTGRVAWSGKIKSENRRRALDLMKLPATTGPAEWWLTEFEDDWPYRVAPADVYFARDDNQNTVARPPIVHYVALPLPTDAAVYALAAVAIVPALVRRFRRRAIPNGRKIG